MADSIEAAIERVKIISLAIRVKRIVVLLEKESPEVAKEIVRQLAISYLEKGEMAK